MCIDPQEQALNWIKKKEENNNLKVQNLPCYSLGMFLLMCPSFGQLPTADSRSLERYEV